MGFTVKTSWQGPYGLHSLGARKPIAAGDSAASDDYQLQGILQDQRTVRCKRQPPVFMCGDEIGAWADGVVSPAVLVDKMPFTTGEVFDGDLDVVAWLAGCESPGAVTVTVYAADGTTSVDAVTLQNSIAATLQERTDTLTGLAASTSYHLHVQIVGGIADGALYMLDVRPGDLSADA